MGVTPSTPNLGEGSYKEHNDGGGTVPTGVNSKVGKETNRELHQKEADKRNVSKLGTNPRGGASHDYKNS